MNPVLYFDYAATTPVDPRVVEAMLPFLSSTAAFGNPASLTHAYGQAAKHAVDQARAQVAELILADASELIWTSGATESINLALKGAAQLYQRKGRHIITLKTEHKAVLDTCQQLEKEGYRVTYLTPLPSGLLDWDAFVAALSADTMLVSFSHLNNETGVIQDIHRIAQLTAERGILFHVDAAQSAGKIRIDVSHTPIDLMSLNAHKLYGPKGIGALYVRRKPRVRVAPQMHGGGQEQGMRSGTLATHQIVGMGTAYQLAHACQADDFKHVTRLRTVLVDALHQLETTSINGDKHHAYPGIVNVCFPGIKADAFMQRFPEIAVSAGSACTAKGIEPSYVLRAMGLSTEMAHSAIRFSWGRFTTEAELNQLARWILERIQPLN